MENFPNFCKIVTLKNGAKNLKIRAIILHSRISIMRDKTEFFRLVIADDSAKINCVLFDRRVRLLKPGDIIYMTECYTKLFKSELTIYKFIEGRVFKIDEFCMIYNDLIDMSIKQETEEPSNKENPTNQQELTKKRSLEKVQETVKAISVKRSVSFLVQNSAYKANRLSCFKKPLMKKPKISEIKRKAYKNIQ